MIRKRNHTLRAKQRAKFIQRRTRLSSLRVDRALRAAGIPANGQAITRVSASTFRRAIIAGRAEQDKDNAWMVDVHTHAEYAGMRCYLSADGKSGMAIKPDGDVVSLFASGKGGNRMGKLIPFAVANGGRKLDCYAKKLHNLYARYGAKAIGKVDFNEGALGEDTMWKKGMDEPPVVAMVLPSSLEELIKKYDHDAYVDLKKVHDYTTQDGITGYDNMIAARDKRIKSGAAGKAANNQ